MLLLAASLLVPQNLPDAQPLPAATEAAVREVRGADRNAWFDAKQAEAAERAAARGLAWLAAHQTEAGAWTGLVGHKQNHDYVAMPNGLPVRAQASTGHGHVGVAAFAVLAFLAGGHLPDRGEYGKVVRAGHDYLVAHCQENGMLADSGTRMYSHAFATLCLAEAYGMAQTANAKSVLERAVNLIVDSQNAYGGWRYNAFDREIDLSVTVCQVQALRAARNIGIRVPLDTIDRAMAYVLKSRVPAGRNQGLFYYKIHGRGAFEKSGDFAINAAALTALSSAGIHDENLTEPVLRFLLDDYPALADWGLDHYFFWYGNYYAAQAFYQAGGAPCRQYFAALLRDLLRWQQADGSWANRVGPGDEWSTAIACILLQMPKQYLPIFQR
ncbi:MAG: terpene cyclase/mutase family protein [Planctomycetes bacterium]|nr:terpene cyclase/mutase family protein [Planctomycetota bacterium]